MLIKGKSKKHFIPLVMLVLVFLFNLCFRIAEPGFIPKETIVNLTEGISFLIAHLLNQSRYLDKSKIIANMPYYYETFIRLKYSFITCLSGMGLCLAGAAFQTMFKNPLASPNIIGVTAGVNLGNVVFILLYTTQALSVMTHRYVFCYGFSVVLIIFIMLAGKLAGIRVRRFSVMDMVIVGSVITQLTNVIVMYLQYVLEAIDSTLLLTYQEITMGIYIVTDNFSLVFFAAATILCMLPIILIRYRFNIVAFEDEDALTIGIVPKRLRFVGMVFGGMLAITAIVFCGEMGILALAIPHICRYQVGADFRKLCYVSVCSGGILMLLCRIISSMFYFQGVALPVNFIISLVVLPVFIIVLAKQKKAFE